MFERYNENKTYPYHYSDESSEIIVNNPFNVLNEKKGFLDYESLEDEHILKKEISRHIDYVVPCLAHLGLKKIQDKKMAIVLKIHKLVMRKKLIQRKQEQNKEELLKTIRTKHKKVKTARAGTETKKVRVKIIAKTLEEIREFAKRQRIKNEIQHKLNLQKQSEMERAYLHELSNAKHARMLRNQKVRVRNAVLRNGY